MLDYSATSNGVFSGLTSWRARPFAPPKVSGAIANISGTPAAGHAATGGSVSFAIRFDTLNQTSAGTESGLAYLNLVIGVDKDCNLATGDPDGVDGSVTIRVLISVSTGS